MKPSLCVDEAGWARHVLDAGTVVRVNLDGMAGVFRLPRRSFRSRAKLGEHLFWHLAEGRAQGEVAGRACELETGALLWVSPGEAFDFAFEGDRRHTVYRFRLQVERGGRSVRLAEPFFVIAHSEALRGWFAELVRESFVDDAQTPVRTRGLVACLTGEIFRRRATPVLPAGDRRFDAAQRQRISEWLSENLAAVPRPAALAQHLGLSHDYFTRRFRATYGRAPRRWFVEERMRLAAQQLAESDLPVTEVAELLGFTDVYFFSRQFRQVWGESPRSHQQRRRRSGSEG